jgi:hypothetical protein
MYGSQIGSLDVNFFGWKDRICSGFERFSKKALDSIKE